MAEHPFDGLRAVVDRPAEGRAVVARFAGVVVVAALNGAEGADDAGDAPVRRLLELCSAAAGEAPGRALARRLATWLGGAEAPPAALHFGTVSAAGDRWAVFLSGEVSLRDSHDAVVRGADVAAWVDQLIDAADGPLVLAIDGAAAGPDEPFRSLYDLRSGVVGGAAVTLTADEPALPEEGTDSTEVITTSPVRRVRPAPARRPEPAPPTPPPPPADDGPLTHPPLRSERIAGAPADERRPPLPDGAPVGPVAGAATAHRGDAPPADAPAGTKADAPAPGDEVPQTRGHLCSRGHLNDPRSHFCVLCGIRMNERTGVLVIGPRPPLGLLVFDDGATYTVDAEYVLGRMPDVDARVQAGSLRSIAIEDRSGSISRVHAEVRVNGWDVMVIDHGSRNGTHVAAPGETAWTALAANVSHRLVPGTRVRLGERTFLFESPSGVR